MKGLLFLFFILLATSSASAEMVSIGDSYTAVSSEVTVPVMINGSGNVAGGVVNVSFDPSIVSLKNIVAGDFGDPVANINNTHGWVKFVAARVYNVNKNEAVLANIVFNGSITGLTGVNVTYAILNNESGQLFTPAIKNGSIEVLLSLDDTPPSSITDLRSSVGDTWINWTWINPGDADFNHTMIYFDGAFVADFTENHFNATGLAPATIHTISTHTADINGNINLTWANNTAVTHGNLPGGLKINIFKPQNYSIIPTGEKLIVQINVTDLAGNAVTSDILSFADLSGPNGASRQVIFSEDAGNYSGEYLVSRDDPSGIWTANITAYNSTASGKASVKLLFTGTYIIQPYTRSHSYLIGDIANFTTRVVKPGSSPQILSDHNLSLNISVYPFNTSTPAIESIDMEFNDTSNLFYGSIDTGLIGPGLFNIVFTGNDTSGNSETAELLIGVTDDFTIEVETEKAFYDRDEVINISGIVKYLNNSPLENIGVYLKIDLHGFKRSYAVTTNETGHFNYSFKPFDTEAGNYSIKAEASNMGLLRFSESNFTIHGLYLVPKSVKMEMVEDSTRNFNFTLYNLGDTTITGLSASVNDLDISDKVTATIDTIPSELQPYQSISIGVQLKAETPVPDIAKFNIEITSDQNSNEISELNIKLFKPDPILKVYPADVITGLNKNQTRIETVAIYNMGYGVLRNVTLHQPENNWMWITSNTSIGDLLPGENATFDIHINSYNVDTGIYRDPINITSDNHHEVQVNVTAFVTELTNGSLLFHVTDALERNLLNANISLINQDTYDEFASSTNSTGYALMTDLPTGRYIFEVSSDGTNTLPQMGIIEVEPMETPKLIEIALYMSFIDFDWEVTPTSIEDYFNVILKMRFETDVPIPLLLASPLYLEYNLLPGEEFSGAFTLYNVGLVSVYNVSINQNIDSGVVFTPLITQINEIKGKSAVRIPYKIKLSQTASSCQRLTGKINARGRYVHFINGKEVISYAGTNIPIGVNIPGDSSCKLESPWTPKIPDIPDLSICINGNVIGKQTDELNISKNLRVNPWIITLFDWGWEDTTEILDVPYDVYSDQTYVYATNKNDIEQIAFDKVFGFTSKIDVNDVISAYLGMPPLSTGYDITETLNINIPGFDGFWAGSFDPNPVGPMENSTLTLNQITTGAGIPLPKLIGGGMFFYYGPNFDCFNCIWLIPIIGADLKLPGLPHIEPGVYTGNVDITIPNVRGDGICWQCIPDDFTVPEFPHFSGTTYVPWDWPPIGGDHFAFPDPVRPKPKPKVTQTIHEVVELSISQNVTMERDAFWAGLGIRNRLPDKNINNVRVDLHIKGNSGSANDKFFIQAPRLNGISSIDGTGVISPLALAKSQWLIIPKPGVGGVDPEGAKYNISANISYSVDGVNFEISTQEIEILVKPQPELVLDYFIPSNVIANKPFKLAVKVTNEGHGEARNFAIETAQPVIYYNPSGLLLDFEIIRSQLQGEDRSTSMKVEFGDIKPGESKIAWWDMVTSIDGTFTKFTGEYTHSSELGGMETSLIKMINTYIIQKQMGSGELGYDFLANLHDDEMHYMLFNSSTGNSTFLRNVSHPVVDMPTPENPVLNLSIEDYTGDWVIVSIDDPYNNAVPIEKVIRTRDGTEIPSYNYWMRNGRILIVDHYEEGFDGNYSVIFKYSNLVAVITTNRTMFEGSTVAEENKTINFNGSGSYDEFGSIVSYKWEFGDETEAIGEKVDHIFSKMGEYQINLTITNDAGVSNKTSSKVKVVKQIIDMEVIQVNFALYEGETPSDISFDDIRNRMKFINQYYLNSSYGTIFLNLIKNRLDKITINAQSDYEIIRINENRENMSIAIREDAIALMVSNPRIIKFFIVNTDNSNYIRENAFDNNIFINRESNYETSLHETGHALGYTVEGINTYISGILPDLYNDVPGKVYYWDLMGTGYFVVPPTDLGSFSKLWLKRLTPKTADFGEYALIPIEKKAYNDSVYIFKYMNINYILESRDLPDNNKVPCCDGTLEDGVIIYKVENFDLFKMEPTNKNWRINIIRRNIGAIDDPIFTARALINLPLIEIPSFLKFEISSESSTPYYIPVIKISECDVCVSINGLILTTTSSSLFDLTSFSQFSHIENKTYPDLDLHAYTPDGKHVGMNYANGEYEMQIPGAFASGDLSNGEEWIFAPKDIDIRYYVDSHDVNKYLEENPEINSSNATIEYYTTYMEYGENPYREQHPDGNWSIMNRTVSVPILDIIEPGVIREILPSPLKSIRNMVFEAGPTWLNFTWLNPPDLDFNHTILYFNGAFLTNVPAPQNYYNITSLTPDTQYELGTHTADTSGNINTTWVNATARTLVAPDTTAPVISNISAVPGTDSAVITWDTDEASDSLMKYGTSSGSYTLSESSSNMVLSHSVSLTGLTSDTLYYYVVNGTDGSHNSAQSTERTFKTQALADTTPPVIESVTLYPANATAGADINVTVNASDNVGVIEVKADDISLIYSYGEWDHGSITAPSTIGDYTVLIKARDAAGNEVQSSAKYTVVNKVGGIAITSIPKPLSIVRGLSGQLNIKLISTANIDDRVWVNITTTGISATSAIDLTWFNRTSVLVEVPSKATIYVPFRVTVPAGAAVGYKTFKNNAKSLGFNATSVDTGVVNVR